jgi:cbb3-type cytochrome oxidase subunit 3
VGLLAGALSQAAALWLPWLAKRTYVPAAQIEVRAGFWHESLVNAAYAVGLITVVTVLICALTHIFRNFLPVLGIVIAAGVVQSLDLKPTGWVRFTPGNLMKAIVDGKLEMWTWTPKSYDITVTLTRNPAMLVVGAAFLVLVGFTYWRYRVRDVTE